MASHDRLWNRDFVTILAIEFLLQLGIFILGPITANYAVYLGTTVTLAGIIAASRSAASLVARPVSGVLSDRFDKKKQLVFSTIAMIAGAALYIFSTSPFLLVAAQIVLGVAFAFKSALIMSLASLVMPKDRIATGVGIVGLGMTLSVALGPLIATLIVDRFGYTVAFASSFAVYAIALVLLMVFRAPEGAGPKRQMRGDASAPGSGGGILSLLKPSSYLFLPVIPIVVALVFISMAQGVMLPLALLIGELSGVEGAASYFVGYTVLAFVSRPLAGGLCDRFGFAPVVIVSCVFLVAAQLVLVTECSAATFAVSGALLGFGHGGAYSSIQAQTVKMAPINCLGRSQNTFFLGMDIAMGGGPLIGGAVIDAFGVRAVLLMTVACVTIGAVLVAVLQRKGVQ